MINFVASAPPAVPAVKNVVFVVAVVVAVIVVVVVVVVVAVGVVVVVVAAVVFAVVVVVVVVVVVDDAVAVGWVLCAPKTLEKRKGFRGQKINPKDWTLLSLGDAGFLQFFRVVSSDYGKPCFWHAHRQAQKEVFFHNMNAICDFFFKTQPFARTHRTKHSKTNRFKLCSSQCKQHETCYRIGIGSIPN